MGRDSIRKRTKMAAPLALLALTLLFATPALAVPLHARTEARDVTGLNHACGVAVDSKGDLYASSAGESKVNVYDSSSTTLRTPFSPRSQTPTNPVGSR